LDPSASFCPFCGQKRGDNIVNTNEANKNAAIKCLSFKNYAAKKTEEGGGGEQGGLNLPVPVLLFVGSRLFAFFRLRNIAQCCVIFPFSPASRTPPAPCPPPTREVYSFPKWLKEKGSEVQNSGSVRTNKHRYHTPVRGKTLPLKVKKDSEYIEVFAETLVKRQAHDKSLDTTTSWKLI